MSEQLKGNDSKTNQKAKAEVKYKKKAETIMIKWLGMRQSAKTV